MMKTLLLLTISFLIAMTLSSQERTTISSNGTGGGDWNTAGTWTPAQIPVDGDDVTIVSSDVVAISSPNADGATTVTVNSGATLTINSGATLTTSGNVSVSGTLNQNGTLNVGDATDDGLIVDGASAEFAIGDAATTNVAGYYKQDNAATISSASGYTATLNMATSGALSDDTNPVLAFLNGSIADFNGADVDFNILDGNTSTLVADAVIDAPGTSGLSWIGTITFGSGASTTVTDWTMEMEANTGFYRTAIDVGTGNTFTLIQTTYDGTGILFTRLDLTSGGFEIDPLVNLTVSSTSGINVTGGSLKIKSDNTGSGELILEAVGIPADVEQFIAGQAWHQITPSTTGNTTADIFQNYSPNIWLMEWLNASQAWSYIVDPELDDALTVGKGYIVYSETLPRADDFTITYSGNLRVTDYNKPAYTAAAGDFELVGNPFSSSIEVIDFGGLFNAVNLEDDIWVWNPGADNYATATGGTGGTYPPYVAPGQSFFVKASSAGATSLSLLENDRGFYQTNNFLKKSAKAGWEDNYGKGTYIMLKVYDEKAYDAAFVNFGENGTHGFERNFDGYKKFGGETAPQLYLVEQDLELSIDYIQSLEEANERVVQMNFKAGKVGEHTLAANLDSLENVKVTLEDTRNGNMHEFNTGEHYTFTASTDDAHDRFLLHFLYSPTGIEDPNDSEGAESSLNIYAYNKAVYIANKDNNNVQSDIVIYDLMGRQVYSNNLQLETSMRIPINVSNTYLIVKVIKGSEVVTQKVFIK